MFRPNTMLLKDLAHELKLPMTTLGKMLDRYADHSNLPYLGDHIRVYRIDPEDYSTWRIDNYIAKRIADRINSFTGQRKAYLDKIKLDNANFNKENFTPERHGLIPYLGREKHRFIAYIKQLGHTNTHYSKYPNTAMFCCVRDYNTTKIVTDHVWVRSPMAIFGSIDIVGQAFAFNAKAYTYQHDCGSSIGLGDISGIVKMDIDDLKRWIAQKRS